MQTPNLKIENILERISDGVVAFDAQMNYTYVNARGGELLGRKPEDLIGKNYWQEYPEAKGTPFANAYVRALETQTPITLEDYYEPFDRWFENRIYPSPDGLSIFFTEITERKRAEEARRESEEKFSKIFYASPVAISITRVSDGRFVDVNDSYLKRLGYGREEIVGHTALEAGLWADPAERAKMMQAISAQGSLRDFEARFRTKAGEAGVALLSRETIELGGEKHFIGTTLDITARKRAEDEVCQRAEQLAALNALGQQVSATLSLEATCEAAVKGMLAAAHPDLAFLFLRQGEKLVLQGILPKKTGKRLGEIPEHRVGECMCGLAVTQGKPLYSRDIFTDMRCTWEECKRAGFRSFAALPLRSGTEIIGVIGLAADAERDFETQAEFLETLTSQAAVALQNATLFEDNQHKLAMLDSLYGGARQLAESLDMEKVAARVARTCVKDFGVKLAWLLHAEPDGSLRNLIHYPKRIEYPAKAVIRWDDSPQGQGPTGRAIRSCQPQVNSDLAATPNFAPWRWPKASSPARPSRSSAVTSPSAR